MITMLAAALAAPATLDARPGLWSASAVPQPNMSVQGDVFGIAARDTGQAQFNSFSPRTDYFVAGAAVTGTFTKRLGAELIAFHAQTSCGNEACPPSHTNVQARLNGAIIAGPGFRLVGTLGVGNRSGVGLSVWAQIGQVATYDLSLGAYAETNALIGGKKTRWEQVGRTGPVLIPYYPAMAPEMGVTFALGPARKTTLRTGFAGPMPVVTLRQELGHVAVEGTVSAVPILGYGLGFTASGRL